MHTASYNREILKPASIGRTGRAIAAGILASEVPSGRSLASPTLVATTHRRRCAIDARHCGRWTPSSSSRCVWVQHSAATLALVRGVFSPKTTRKVVHRPAWDGPRRIKYSLIFPSERFQLGRILLL